jgi:transposase
MKKGNVIRYFDLNLKLQLVNQIESGELKVSDVSRIYQVSGTAVYKWLRKYSALYSRKSRVIVESKSLSKKNKELSERITSLERAVGQKQMRVDYLEQIVNQATKHYGEDVEKKSKRLP